MKPPISQSWVVATADAAKTVAALLRQHLPGESWRQVRQLVSARRVIINGELALDPARRMTVGDVVELLAQPVRVPLAFVEELVIRHLDAHVVVVEKPALLTTVRHPAEMDWSQSRRDLVPTLDDRLHKAIARRLRLPVNSVPRLRKVHRLDKLTSGLLVFARSALAERELGRQFRTHSVDRRYLAIVSGRPTPQAVRTWLVRDRGDGRRGSSTIAGTGKLAVTHIDTVEPIGDYSLLSCHLETGRTHQIRIHLSELGHPVCGDPVYCLGRDGSTRTDESGAPRLALHAAELGFDHPVTGERLRWSMPLPEDLRQFLERLRR